MSNYSNPLRFPPFMCFRELIVDRGAKSERKGDIIISSVFFKQLKKQKRNRKSENGLCQGKASCLGVMMLSWQSNEAKLSKIENRQNKDL